MGGTKHAPVGERGRESLDVDVSCGHLAYIWKRRKCECVAWYILKKTWGEKPRNRTCWKKKRKRNLLVPAEKTAWENTARIGKVLGTS